MQDRVDVAIGVPALMWYTLAKGYTWVLAGVLLGLVIGWLLRSVAARRQVARARAHHVDSAELERLRTRVAELEAAASTPAATPHATPPPEPEASVAEPAPRAASRPDDLTAVGGISPAVEDLCHGIGIRTWTDLATTEPSLLRTMLVDAGLGSIDPARWPEEAALLAAGRRDGSSDDRVGG